MSCRHEGCAREATHAVRITVPPTGWPIEAGRNLTSVFGLKLCRDHALEMTADQFFCEATNEADGTHKLRTVFTAMARAKGSQIPPDFDRAFVEPVRLDHPDARPLFDMDGKR